MQGLFFYVGMKVPVKVYLRRSVGERFLWSLLVVFISRHLDLQLIDCDTRHVSSALTKSNKRGKNKRIIKDGDVFALRTEPTKMSKESVGSRSHMPLDHSRLSSWWAINLPRPIIQPFKIPLEKFP